MNSYPISQIRHMRRANSEHTIHYKDQVVFSFISRLAEFREELEMTREIFAQGRVWPDQCNYIIGTFEPIQKTAGNLAESFDSKNQQAKLLGRNRYTIIANAYHFYEQIDKTISFLREFGATNQQWSGKKSKLKEIQNSLRQLDSSFNELMKGLDSIKE